MDSKPIDIKFKDIAPVPKPCHLITKEENVFDAIKKECLLRGVELYSVLRKADLTPYMTKKIWGEKDPKSIESLKRIQEILEQHPVIKEVVE